MAVRRFDPTNDSCLGLQSESEGSQQTVERFCFFCFSGGVLGGHTNSLL